MYTILALFAISLGRQRRQWRGAHRRASLRQLAWDDTEGVPARAV